ncbi:malto-oligosyltrehalose trehalohydrolase [Terriglobus sp.]|uniref:malto-oligosyltrehalose trehalohydrolase n=1 Tax=Terriglobus sp. TaxID=1889013 RepID=UPI003AFFB3CB
MHSKAVAETESPSFSRTNAHAMLFGAELLPGAGVRFRIFAPAVDSFRLRLEGRSEDLPMQSIDNGWFERVEPSAKAGTHYRFVLPDGTAVADPASRYQPQDVHGPSEVIDPASYLWTDDTWQGRSWSQTILYELHIGTFTPEGTFAAAAEKLPKLAEIGITAIEIMCLSEFAGNRNWGYDSVLLYAPDATYGRPEDLKGLVDMAHRYGIQVILDVVYNHFGPEGNDLPKYFPQLLTDKHNTPWGDALNFDEDEAGSCAKQVRELIIQNALYWVEEFHIDGLRLDAAHAIIDQGKLHVLDELALRVRECAAAQQPPRHVHLIREDEQNIANKLLRNERGHCEKFTAQWNHDMSHMLGAAMRQDFSGGADDGETFKQAETVAQGFVIAAEESGQGAEVRCHVPPTAFVAFVQTHDLIGNRIGGERIHALAPPQSVRAVTALLLLTPQIPMFFMGDEFAAKSPFPYFCDFGGDLGKAVSKGRREFLRQLHNADDAALAKAPDPQQESTFLSAKLDWQQREDSDLPDWYRRILRARLERISPALESLHDRCGTFRVLRAGAFEVVWKLDNITLTGSANLRPDSTDGFTEKGEDIWLEGSAESSTRLGPWSVRWTVAPQG